jgi:hypothetical protein
MRDLRIIVEHSQSLPLTTFGAKPGCEVGPAHCGQTFLEPSNRVVWRSKKTLGFQRISDKEYLNVV